MAEQRALHERIVIGQWYVEQICGSRHALDEVYWDRYEDILHMHAWLTLPSHTRRSYLRGCQVKCVTFHMGTRSPNSITN